MYDKVNYILDNQAYLYELFAHSDRGRAFQEYCLAAFVICICMLATAAVILFAAKASPEPKGRADNSLGSPYISALLIFSALFCAFLFFARGRISFEYMDFSYYLEGVFDSFKSFIANKVYLSNIHRPGYLLISCFVRRYMGGSREAYIILNMAVLAASAPLAFKLLAKNVSPASALLATIAFVVSPMSVYGVFRYSPYWIIAFLFIALVYSYVSFCETGEKKYAAAMAGAVFLLPFFHVLTSIGIAAFFTAAILSKKQFLKHGKYAAVLFTAVVIAAIGTGIFNFQHVLFFRNEIYAISVPSTDRLHVYYKLAGGNVEFILFCLRFIPNLYMSFVSANTLSPLH
jgi:hypothetical protein